MTTGGTVVTNILPLKHKSQTPLYMHFKKKKKNSKKRLDPNIQLVTGQNKNIKRTVRNSNYAKDYLTGVWV